MGTNENDQSILDQICDFPIPSYEEWKQVVERSLKGSSFSKLLTNTYEGITLKPMYQEKDLESLPFTDAPPGKYPYVRGTKQSKEGMRWLVAQEMNHPIPEVTNEWIKNDLPRGLNAIHLALDERTMNGLNMSYDSVVEKKGISLSSLEDVETVLKNVDYQGVPFLIQAGVSAVPCLGFIAAYFRKNQLPLDELKGCIGADPLAMLVKKGATRYNLESYLDEMAALLTWTKKNGSELRTILIESHPYHDGGGNAVQELAFMLASGVYYIRELQTRGHEIDEIATSIQFSMSIGSNLFMELAKLRSARMLWAKIIEAFGGDAASQKMKIHARTSSWTKTSYDSHVNILRGTVEAFTAAVAGVDSMHVTPFDETVTLPNEFSRRVARNIQLVLQEEANITRTTDPVGGSWYVESITGELAQKSWTLFQEVEEQGGILMALEQGFPQRVVNEVSKQKIKDIEKRKLVFVGATMYPNNDETSKKYDNGSLRAMLETRAKSLQEKAAVSVAIDWDLLVESVINAAQKGATIEEISSALGNGEGFVVKKIKAYRATEAFEALRQFTERKKEEGTPLKVFLSSIGPLPDHKPRSDFTASFFETGGFEVIKNDGFINVEKAIEATINSDANIAVICGKNESYQEYAVQIASAVKEKRPNMHLYVAGKQNEDLENKLIEAGVNDFIHIGTNCFKMLHLFQQVEGGREDE